MTAYITREHTIGVRRGRHPQCEFCTHITERAYEVTEATHAVARTGFACVSCWSALCVDGDQ